MHERGKQWKPEDCPFRLCKTFVKNVGFPKKKTSGWSIPTPSLKSYLYFSKNIFFMLWDGTFQLHTRKTKGKIYLEKNEKISYIF